ncbi:GMP/IMP nucleotidase [Methylomicrobium sp. Wu6]|uniref:GMP/IMP nucleotidase n=1 Tax=Methylomicrobium sp. Wu6 TaxID=3107928 RepID=UPI002DD62713|nr:GMP/IMP nucleotidase [Methylomicrobium sp. Wu6]MEC4747598.1 GMP/IMP nucleotidase [Methylomicrobium sp. Wu6]
MIDWSKIDTVLLDMDGTLLDLNFDNHFWKEFVPLSYAQKKGLTLEQAKDELVPLFKGMEGKLEWYCLDYWSRALELDIVGLKAEIAGLISVLPHVVEFLVAAKRSPRKVLLVTNAHPGSLGLKMEKTCLHPFFDEIISSHDCGKPKEHTEFWRWLNQRQPFDNSKTLLIDDSLAVLNSAKAFGIQNLLSVSRPDSRQPKKVIVDYPAIEDFRELMAGL